MADPKKAARELMQRTHDINTENVYTNWQDIVAKEKFADFVIISTPDKCHKVCMYCMHLFKFTLTNYRQILCQLHTYLKGNILSVEP